MASGFSLHIGLNELKKSSYPGVPPLVACMNDANDMCALADKIGFDAATLCDDCATHGKVVNAIADKASRLVAGDIFPPVNNQLMINKIEQETKEKSSND